MGVVLDYLDIESDIPVGAMISVHIHRSFLHMGIRMRSLMLEKKIKICGVFVENFCVICKGFCAGRFFDKRGWICSRSVHVTANADAYC